MTVVAELTLTSFSLPCSARAADGMSGALGLWAALQEDHLRPPPIKKSDALFAKEDLEFVWGMEGINLDELNDLFELVHAVGLLRQGPHAKLFQEWICSPNDSAGGVSAEGSDGPADCAGEHARGHLGSVHPGVQVGQSGTAAGLRPRHQRQGADGHHLGCGCAPPAPTCQ